MDETTDRQPSILIVDDVTKNIQVLGSILRQEGYNLSFATDGRQALEMVETERFDLILLDVMMPGLDGFAVCQAIKESPQNSPIPIIFLTARTEAEDILEGFRVGAVDYVTKPFHSEELLARVRTHLELKASRDLIQEKNDELSKKNEELRLLSQELQQALKEIKTLNGLIPICSSCRRIRRENADPRLQDSWVPLERYVTEYTDAQMTHSICPECAKKLYPDFFP